MVDVAAVVVIDDGVKLGSDEDVVALPELLLAWRAYRSGTSRLAADDLGSRSRRVLVPCGSSITAYCNSPMSAMVTTKRDSSDSVRKIVGL